MALIVSDTSPLSLLIRIDLPNILPALFQRVIIPREVATELQHPKAPTVVQEFVSVPPSWLTIQSPQRSLILHHLDPGEVAAISLAIELKGILLIDELDGRTAARAQGLAVVGAVGVLERAANKGLLSDLAESA